MPFSIMQILAAIVFSLLFGSLVIYAIATGQAGSPL